jgi:asparagine synthase (glutamine-hydrolysing)
VARGMADTLRHRGPDDSGTWTNKAAGIGLSFRRLSILDLSCQGHQPMVSATARYVIVFNGEIYNYQDIRAELEAHGDNDWRGHSDTEVMLAAFQRWGIEDATRRFNGMFAFAAWDEKERALYLCRDRMGEKPLYYGWVGKRFLFASELKAIRSHPEFKPRLDRDALALYLRHNCVPAPHSIYKDVRKLPPGTLLKVPGGVVSEPKAYWSVRKAMEEGIADRFAGTDAEAIAELDSLLRDSVGRRMLADVPLGAFLSGGIDSSTVVGLMQAQSGRPVKTFTIGFSDSVFDEAKDAKCVAKHLGTDHTELYVSESDALDTIQHLPTIYDEPFSDSSQVPTYLVSKLARQHVTVSLSGDGGDELFGGYNRHSWIARIWKATGWLPVHLRRPVAAAMQLMSPATWDSLFASFGGWLPKTLNQRMPGYKIHRLAEVLRGKNMEAMYLAVASHWADAGKIVLAAREPETEITRPQKWPEGLNFSERMMYMDSVTYLPDDILTKLDRASMAVSLEGRVPLLDHRVVEFAWRLPLDSKIRDKQGKWILRQVLHRYVPEPLVERPKMGFGIALGTLLRGPLRDWAETLLSKKRLDQEAVFNSTPIREKWEEHLAGKGNWEYHLWDVLMFQAWLESNPGVEC